MSDPQALFADYAAGEISPENFQALEAALREDADLRREFIEYMNIDSALGDLAALSAAEEAEIEKEWTPFSRDVRPRRIYRVAAVIGSIAAMLLIAVFLWIGNPGENQDETAATIVTGINAALVRDGQSWRDTALPAGSYRLDRGLLHLRFDCGVRVFVEAPARFEAVSGKRLLLHGGRLTANVPPEGTGFTVQTPDAEIVDFGTEFCVDVEEGASEVHVFAGLVRVRPRSRKDGRKGKAVDLRTSQAIKIEQPAEQPVAIALAKDRFIRSFEEPKFRYPRLIKLLAPVAYYRMPIRDRGMVSKPPQYSGVVLTGEGRRPPNARGVGNGGSLRVLADSTGRGGRVDTPPPLRTGQFTLAAFVYLEKVSRAATVATNIQGDTGNFALSLDKNGFLRATIRDNEGRLQSLSGDTRLPVKTWRHLVMMVDGKRLRVYDTGRLVASSPSAPMADGEAATLWFGTDAGERKLWNGRIDELSLFDRALGDAEIDNLHRAAMEEMEGSE